MVKRCFDNSCIISSILNRFLNCMQLKKVCYHGNLSHLSNLYPRIEIQEIIEWDNKEKDAFYYIEIDEYNEKIISWLVKNIEGINALIYYKNPEIITEEVRSLLGRSYELKSFSGYEGKIFLLGDCFEYKKETVPEDFKVLAVIHCYNEADVIKKTIEYLLSQEIDIYAIDNWSNDGTYEIIKEYSNKFGKRVRLERFPESGRENVFNWYNQLSQTEKISKQLEYNWYIHYDADEMRISPWANANLRQTIYRIDQLGYNLIENTVIDFKMTDKDQDNIFMLDTYFDFGHRPTHFEQTKTWKKSDIIDIKSTGGHIAQVPNPLIFPLKILNRHYPLRSFAQAQKKIFIYRKPRFEKEKKERGWHGHYDKVQKIQDILMDKSNLILWNNETFYEYYFPLFTGCGVARDEEVLEYQVEKCNLKECKVVIYGAGKVGKKYYLEYAKYNEIVAWVDKNYLVQPYCYGEKIEAPTILETVEFDYVIIAIADEGIRNNVKDFLFQMGVIKEKIREI